MCIDCNDLEIPQGPAGDNGINGTDGTTVLYSFNSSSATGSNTSGAGTIETTMGTYTLPTDTWINNGDEVELNVFHTFAGTNAVTIKIKLNSVVVYSYSTGVTAGSFFLRIKASRSQSDVQHYTIERFSTVTGSNDFLFTFTSADEDTSNVFEITGTNSVAGANQVIVNRFNVYKYNAI